MTNILDIKAYPTIGNLNSIPTFGINYQADYFTGQSDNITAINGQGVTNPATTPLPTYSDFVTAATALQNSTSGGMGVDICNGILSRTNADAVAFGASIGYFSSYQLVFVDAPIETQIQKDILAAAPEVLSGTTDANGDVVFTFAKTYSSVPNLFPSVEKLGTPDSAHSTHCVITAASITGCTIRGMKGANTTVILLNTAVDPDTIVPTGTKVNLLVYK